VLLEVELLVLDEVDVVVDDDVLVLVAPASTPYTCMFLSPT